MVAGLHAGDAGADLADHARALMAEDRGEDAFAVEPVERVGVGMADAGRHDLDQHLAALGPSRSSSTISSGCFAAKATAARVFMAVVPPDSWRRL